MIQVGLGWMPFASFRSSLRSAWRQRVAPNLNQKVENATLKNYSVSTVIGKRLRFQSLAFPLPAPRINILSFKELSLKSQCPSEDTLKWAAPNVAWFNLACKVSTSVRSKDSRRAYLSVTLLARLARGPNCCNFQFCDPWFTFYRRRQFVLPSVRLH